jgi:methylglutaconyl-CoA hydratase
VVLEPSQKSPLALKSRPKNKTNLLCSFNELTTPRAKTTGQHWDRPHYFDILKMGSVRSVPIFFEQRGPAAWLWLNRPEVRNALNDELIAGLTQQLKALEKNKTARVIVIAGRGAAFCAGGDIARMDRVAKQTAAKGRKAAAEAANFFHRIHTFPKPVIARVHAMAFAGGMGLAAACDMIVAAEEAEFSLPEVRIGLVPATISPYLVRAIGARAALRYALTGDRLSARDAERLGLVQQVVPAGELDAAVDKLVGRLAQAGPQALARTKNLFATVAASPLDAKLRARTAAVLAEVRAGDEAREGIRSFLEKRKPSWTG